MSFSSVSIIAKHIPPPSLGLAFFFFREKFRDVDINKGVYCQSPGLGIGFDFLTGTLDLFYNVPLLGYGVGQRVQLLCWLILLVLRFEWTLFEHREVLRIDPIFSFIDSWRCASGFLVCIRKAGALSNWLLLLKGPSYCVSFVFLFLLTAGGYNWLHRFALQFSSFLTTRLAWKCTSFRLVGLAVTHSSWYGCNCAPHRSECFHFST